MAASLILATVALGAGAAAIDSRAKRREAAAEAAYPPTGQVIEVGTTRVHAHLEGSGADLVLIHGASGNTRDFTFALVGLLKSRYRVIAFDRPGFGWSEDLGRDGLSPLAQADLLRAAAERLGVRRPIILGHSYGGAVAMAWALRDPGGPGALVILSGATMPWPGGLGPWYAVTSSRIGGATVVPMVTAFAPISRAEDTIESIFAPAPVPTGYASYVGVGLTLRRSTLRTNARQVNGLKPYLRAMTQGYPQLTLPVELVHGAADSIVPLSVHAEPLARLLPASRLTVLDQAGHMPHHSHPADVVAAIDRAAARAGLRAAPQSP